MTLEGVHQIEILNRDGETGFIYEKGLEDCQRFLDRPADHIDTRREIMADTYVR